MLKAKKALRLLCTLALLGILVFAMAAAEVITNGGQRSFGGRSFGGADPTRIESDETLAKTAVDHGHDPMTSPGKFPKSYQCVNSSDRLINNWKIHVDAEKKSDEVEIFIKIEFDTASPGILADCLRDSTFTGDEEFAWSHFGQFVVVPRKDKNFSTMSDISVNTDSGNSLAKITTTGRLSAPVDALQISKDRSYGRPRNDMLLGEMTVTAKNLSITSADGATIRRQDAASVEFTLVSPTSLVTIDLAPEVTPAPSPNSRTEDHLNTVLLFPLVGLAPWVAFLLISRRSATSPHRTVRTIFGWLTLTIAITGLLTIYVQDTLAYTTLAVLFVAVPVALLLTFTRTDVTSPRAFTIALATALAITALAVAGIDIHGSRFDYQDLSVAGILGLAAAAALPVWGDRRRGLLFGAACLAGVLVLLTVRFPFSFLAPIGLVPWAVTTYTVVRRWRGRRALAVTGATLTLLCLSPVQLALTNWSLLTADVLAFNDFYVSGYTTYIAMTLLEASKLALFVYLARLLWLARDEPAELGGTVLKAAAIGCVLVVARDSDNSARYAGIAVAVYLTLALLVLIHNDRNSVRLAVVTPAAHARLLRLDARRRSMLDYATTHYRAARAKVAAHEVTPADAMTTQRTLDAGAGLFRPRDRAGVMLLRAAQGSAGGNSPGRNALFGLLAGALISLPFAVYEALPLFKAAFDETAEVPVRAPLLVAIEGVEYFRWAVYAALFGYFYTAIRCTTPTTKAMALLLVVLPAELVAIDFTTPSGTFLSAAGIKAGFALFFCLSLGLAWEWWLARAASVRWGRIRDFSRLKSFLVPASTIVIAGATALATGFASVAVQEILQPLPKPQEQTTSQVPGPPSSAPQTPSPTR